MRTSLTVLAAALLLTALAVSGCGLKGDLFLPEASPPPPDTLDRDEPESSDD